jgi:hypothetical protein
LYQRQSYFNIRNKSESEMVCKLLANVFNSGEAEINKETYEHTFSSNW